MADPGGDWIVSLFDEAQRGNKQATDALVAALYGELHRLAGSHLHRYAAAHPTLSATTLLHEAYVDIAQRSHLEFPSRAHFLAYASRAMRGLVTDYVRRRQAVKRGGDLTFAPFDEAAEEPTGKPIDLEPLHRALEELDAVDPELASLVDLKFFCGFSFVEIAELRGVSERTVQRDWAKARLLLHQSISDEP
jgi:RNA polymerase sigma factor (TIGR02999 family)